MEPLEQEANYFASRREEWADQHLGQFALVQGENLVGFYPSFEVAYGAGIDSFGLEPFFIKQITATEETAQFPALNVGLIGARP